MMYSMYEHVQFDCVKISHGTHLVKHLACRWYTYSLCFEWISHLALRANRAKFVTSLLRKCIAGRGQAHQIGTAINHSHSVCCYWLSCMTYCHIIGSSSAKKTWFFRWIMQIANIPFSYLEKKKVAEHCSGELLQHCIYATNRGLASLSIKTKTAGNSLPGNSDVRLQELCLAKKNVSTTNFN